MVSDLLHSLLSLHGWQVYLLVGVLAFGEAAVLLGFVLPGETAVILGGVSANLGHASLVVVAVIAVVAAIVGDSTGYEVGRLIGPRLLELGPLRKRRRAFEAAQQQLRRWGGRAVFVGRFTAFLRAVIPGLAGMSRMAYPRFLVANAAGGIIWAVGYTFLGYALGSAYRSAERYSTDGSAILLAAAILVAVGLRIREHRKQRRPEEEPDGEAQGPAQAAAVEVEMIGNAGPDEVPPLWANTVGEPPSSPFTG